MREFEAVVQHLNPIGRSDSNYIARVDLSVFGLGDQVEQVWLTAMSDGLYEVACIPLSAYGIAFRDVVRLDGDGVYVESVVEKRGNRVLRALLGEVADYRSLMGRLEAAAQSAVIDYEVHGERFIAFNVVPGADIGGLVDLLQSGLNARSLQVEWSDRRDFVTPSANLG